MPSGYRGYSYEIDDECKIRVLHSRADVFHLVRAQFMDLHVWSDEDTHHIGFKFRSILGDERAVCTHLADKAAAVASLRAALLQGLKSALVPESAHRALRDRVVADLTAAGTSLVDPWNPIFEYVSDQAAMLFGDRWPGVRVEIAGATGPYYRESSKLYANASTDMRIEKLDDCPVVRVGIWDEKFNRETYAAIYALLVHELVCHVAAPRVEYGDPNESVFAEGFVDWAAEKWFERWLPGMDVKLRAAARHFGRHMIAVGKDPAGGNDYWKPRFVGHKAAQNLVDLLQDAGIAPELAIDRVMVLARELTLLDVDLEEKDIFVGSLGLIGPVMRQRLLRWGHGEGSVEELLLPAD